jgi:hypothetical protein
MKIALLSLIIFIIGFYVVATYKTDSFTETFQNEINTDRCPNLLIQKGSEYYLKNTKLMDIPGVNPIRFSNLEEYTEFMDWQRSQGIKCPVLYLQQSYDAQGGMNYRQRPDPSDLQGGLPPNLAFSNDPTDASMIIDSNNSKLVDSNRDDPSFNKNFYPGFDSHNQYIGLNGPLDKMFNNNKFPGYDDSPNPMDTQWGGPEMTDVLVKQGFYADREVYKDPMLYKTPIS